MKNANENKGLGKPFLLSLTHLLQQLAVTPLLGGVVCASFDLPYISS